MKMMQKIATAVELSANAKLGGISTTYAGIQSCPTACPFKTTGACYALSGPVGIQWRKTWSDQVTQKETAWAESKAIRSLTGEHDLRIHTAGDCSTDEAARIVADAAEVHMSKHGKAAFTYTHAWRTVARESWGKVSVIASCETVEEIQQARARGYATAMVVQSYDKDTTYVKEGAKIVPCPEITGRAESCKKCRLCMQDDKLKAADVTIAFAAHGPTKKMAAALESKNATAVA